MQYLSLKTLSPPFMPLLVCATDSMTLHAVARVEVIKDAATVHVLLIDGEKLVLVASQLFNGWLVAKEVSKQGFYKALREHEADKIFPSQGTMRELKNLGILEPKANACNLIPFHVVKGVLEEVAVRSSMVFSLIQVERAALQALKPHQPMGANPLPDPSVPPEASQVRVLGVTVVSRDAGGVGTSGGGGVVAMAVDWRAINQAGGAGSDRLKAQLPTSLPPIPILSEQQMREDYGLKSLGGDARTAAMACLESDLASFKEWCKQPINTQRPVSMVSIREATWEAHEKHVHQFLGYLLKHHSVSPPSITSYLDAPMFASYLSFLRGRGADKSTLVAHLSTGKRVVEWLKGVMAPPHFQEHSARFAYTVDGLGEWMEVLRAQIQSNLVGTAAARRQQQVYLKELEAREEGQALQGDGEGEGEEGSAIPELPKGLSAGELVARVEKLRLGALEVLEDEGQCYESAVAIQGATMACCFFGHLPPMRASIVASMKDVAPAQPPGRWMWQGGPIPEGAGCDDVDCQHPTTCLGNRLHWRSSRQEQLLLDVPHHKNTKHWKGRHINLELPRELNQLMVHLVKWGRRKILAELGNPSGVGSILFVHPTRGVPFTFHTVSSYWKDLVLSDLPASQRFGVQLCRSIFVGERRSVDRVEGPVDKAAAMIMGHCERVWDEAYDRHYDMRNAAQGVQAMERWREGVLKRHMQLRSAAAGVVALVAPPSVPPVVPPAAAEAAPVGVVASRAVPAAEPTSVGPATAEATTMGPVLVAPVGVLVAGGPNSPVGQPEAGLAGGAAVVHSEPGSDSEESGIIDLCDSD